LPLAAQFPVFIALYLVLRHFSKHPPGGHAAVARGDFSWLGHHFVPDITAHANAHWSGFLLLAIYALSQLASTYFMSSTMDKTQRVMMMFLPLVFVSFLVRFPTGLVLYWVTTNLWTVGQGLVTRRLVPRPAAPEPQKKTSRTPPRDEPDGGDGAARPAPAPKPKPASAQAPRRVKRKKKARR
jgi:YidC/Oxa1 family membrane protein insertase